MDITNSTTNNDLHVVVFDIGGVLVRTEDWSGRRKWEHLLGMPDRALSDLVFNCDAALLASTGKGPDEAIWQFVATECGLAPEGIAQLRADFWSGDRLNAPLADYIRGLRKHLKTGILSNAWPEMRDLNVRQFGLEGLVDETVYSFQSGVLKPEPRSYHYVLQRLGVSASQTVMVDDAQRNITGAQAVGMRTVRFHNTPQAIEELNDLLGIGFTYGVG
jgi:putative hydrolase of the HAD superfamily